MGHPLLAYTSLMYTLPRPLLRLFCLLLCCSWLGACTQAVRYPAQPTELTACKRLLDAFTAEVARHDVHDAQDYPLPSYPYLRSDRFLAGYDPQLLQPDALEQWLSLLRAKADTAWRLEWQRLPPGSRHALGADHTDELPAGLSRCGDRLLAFDRNRPGFIARVRKEVQRPDEYSTWRRTLGLYHLTSLIVSSRFGRLQRELRQEFALGLQDAPDEQKVLYEPPPSTLTPAKVRSILARARSNPLGIPLPEAADLQKLFRHFAPRFQVWQQGSDDIIGRVSYATDRPQVDGNRPLVYMLPSYMRFRDEVLLQLNYVIWFPARTSRGWSDLYAGHLDGLNWRVTLSSDGRPLLYDVMHNCGCYHSWVVGPALRLRGDIDLAEPPLLLRPEAMTATPTVKLAPRTHYLRGVGNTEEGGRRLAYTLTDYDRLRALPGKGDRTVSMFDSQGLIPSSRRAERLLLWPMGVPLPGGMRQWGHHAIAFVGRRHADQPDLIELLFEYPPADRHETDK